MAHRGRLNVLANIVGKPLAQIFAEFEGNAIPSSYQGSGDVKYHLGADGHPPRRHGGETITVTLAPNPSHLESVEPGGRGHGAGQAGRARRPRARDGCCRSSSTATPPSPARASSPRRCNLSQLHGYRTGGTLHVVVNNQIGFTTPPEDARSLDLLHRRRQDGRGADLPRERRRPRGGRPRGRGSRSSSASSSGKDVVIDMVCYRRSATTRATSRATPSRSVREDQDAPVGGDALRRAAGARGRRHRASELERGQGRLKTGSRCSRTRPRDGRARARSLARTARTSPRRRTPRRCGATAEDGAPGPRERSRGLQRPPQAAVPLDAAARGAARRQGRRRLGDGRGARLRHAAAARACPCASPARTAAAAPSRQRHAVLVRRARPARSTCRSTPVATARRRFEVYNSLALRGRGAGLRVRLLGGRPASAGALGGAVRRLRQRRAGHHRPVHRRGRDEVEPAERPRAAAAARLRGPGAGALLSARLERFLQLCAEDNIQVANPTDPGAVLPPPAPPDAARRREAARGHHAEEPAAPPAARLAARRADRGPLPAGARRRDAAARRSVRRVVLCSRQGLLRPR